MGRPRIQVDEKLLEDLASIGCTTEEMATILGVSKRTLETRFCAVIEKGRADLDMSLRRQQVTVAKTGNVTMLIWLGKQRLGQSDKVENTVKTDRLNEVIAALKE
jgi:DNA-binding XRE family transcriptional regulator